jgi:hypothetical protein
LYTYLKKKERLVGVSLRTWRRKEESDEDEERENE